MKNKIKNPTKISFKNAKNDIFSGIIVALVSIPISMGYAQVAGLPAVYGLYGSIFPVLIYAFFASSPQFVIGVDAMPAVMIGSAIVSYGIQPYSEEALMVIPTVTFLVACWLFFFAIIQAGRVLKYISNPVLGGFISGVGATIILMQLPKLWGGSAGTGQIIDLIPHIISTFQDFNWFSCLLGFGTVAIILVAKHFIPKFPMSVVMLVLGFLIAYFFKIDRFGVKLLSAVDGTMPKLMYPHFSMLSGHVMDYVILSLTIALVVMAQTLLSANSYATRYDYKINNTRELAAYGLMNLAGSAVGCLPINGSVSRTGIADQFGCKSQLMNIVAGISMILILLFATKLFVYLPVPVLTGIVLCALIGILDIKQAKRLLKCNKGEFLIFMCAFIGVLFLGTIYGVLIGVLLSFFSVVQKAVVPPRIFLGKLPNSEGFYDLNRFKNAKPIQNTVIYRFGGNLFFANVGTFVNDIEGALKPETKYVIVDGSAIGNIDITASDKLLDLSKKLEKRGIQFYLTEHQGEINDLLREYGSQDIIENGKVRRTIALALKDCGFDSPYPLEGNEIPQKEMDIQPSDNLAELEWAFGDEAEERMEQMVNQMVHSLGKVVNDSSVEQIGKINLETMEKDIKWKNLGLFDEEELLQKLIAHLEEDKDNPIPKEKLIALERLIEKRKLAIEQKVSLLNPKAIELLHKRMNLIEKNLQKHQISQEEIKHFFNLKNAFIKDKIQEEKAEIKEEEKKHGFSLKNPFAKKHQSSEKIENIQETDETKEDSKNNQ